MLDTNKLDIDNFNDMLFAGEIEQTTVTLTSDDLGDNYKNQNFYLYRSGRVVFLFHFGNVDNSTAGEFTLSGTIPDFYRPINAVYAPVAIYGSQTFDIGRVVVTQQGGIRYKIPTTRTREYHFSLCYITPNNT